MLSRLLMLFRVRKYLLTVFGKLAPGFNDG